MVDSGSVNGIPATASHFLLTTELRGRLGFKGVVISDYGDVPALATTYHIASDLAGAAALAINAGVDVAMLPFNADQWQTAVQQDVASARDLRGADQPGRVRRILTLKFQLGLFDHPLVEREQGRRRGRSRPGRHPAGRARVDHPAAQPEQRAAAVAVEQAGGDRAERGLHDQPARRLERQLAGRRSAAGHVCCMGPAGPDPARHHRAQGPAGRGQNVASARSKATAVADAASADAVVVAVGEKAYAEGLGDNPAPAAAARPEEHWSARWRRPASR